MSKIWLTIGLVVGFGFWAGAQNPSPDELRQLQRYEDSLGVLAYMIINDSLELNRFAAVKAFIPKFVKALKIRHSFYYPFKQLQPYISILYPPDSSFRVITWQVAGDADFRNFGTIQMRADTLHMFPLIDRSETYPYPQVEHVELPPKQWFGAIYYRLMPVKRRRTTRYLLFGFDNYTPTTRRKVLDVLTFKDGKPLFGAPIIDFPEKGETKHRLVLEYYSGSSVSLNYDASRGIIIYDHLIITRDRDGAPLSVPDGSYEGFEIKRGRLKHIDKVFHEKQNEPPRPHPVLNDNKDILGRPN